MKAASLSAQLVGSSTVESPPQKMLTAYITGSGVSYESCNFLSFEGPIIFQSS